MAAAGQATVNLRLPRVAPAAQGSLPGLSGVHHVDHRNKAASYFYLQKWVYSGIAENCYLGQAHYSKKASPASKGEEECFFTEKEEVPRAAVEERERSGANASHWLSLLLGKEKISLLLG